MRFDIITIFPKLFDSYFEESLLGKAREKGLIEINVHDLRNWSSDKHDTVDDQPYGGGRGMVMKVGPIYRVVNELKEESEENTKVILLTPRGRKFSQKIATDFSGLDNLIFICGRYEGIDERVSEYIADFNISIGDYVLMGGELAALVIIESTTRLIPGVVQKPNLLENRITEEKGFVEYPQYTRPEVFEPEPGIKWKVPEVLLSGNHEKVKEWREKHQEIVE